MIWILQWRYLPKKGYKSEGVLLPELESAWYQVGGDWEGLQQLYMLLTERVPYSECSRAEFKLVQVADGRSREIKEDGKAVPWFKRREA